MNTEEIILKEFKEKFDNLIKSHNGRIVITSHINPDDDSIASSISVYTYLKEVLKINNPVEIYYTNNQVDRWSNIKHFEKIKFVKDVAEILDKKDLLILLDCQGYYRVSNLPEQIIEKNIITVVIDHHKTSPDRDYTLMLTYPTIFKSSNAEIIYSIFFNNTYSLNKDIAEVLLIGIYGDTGGFRYVAKDQSSAFITAKEILDKSDIKMDAILGKMENYSIEQLSVLSLLLKNIKVFKLPDWGKFSISYITKNEAGIFTKEQISQGKAVYSFYQKAIGGAKWGLVVYPDKTIETKWHLSFRSQPGYPNVRLIGQALDPLGGGHDAAGGGSLDEERLGIKIDEKVVIEKFLEYLNNNKPSLIPE